MHFTLLLSFVLVLAHNSTVALEANNKNRLGNLTRPGAASCRANSYGQPQEPSCRNAWSKLPRTGTEIVFGSRGQGGIDVSIPLRYQSDDGLCVIELRARTGPRVVRGDVTTFLEISDAAERVIDQCVARIPAGGSTTDFSSNHQLTVTVSAYRSQAICDLLTSRPPWPAEAFNALQQLPSRSNQDQFLGLRDVPTGGTYVRLPKRYSHADEFGRECKVEVSRYPTDGSTKETWHAIWAAGIDIYTTCVMYGMTGTVYGLGDNGQLQIRISVGDTSAFVRI